MFDKKSHIETLKIAFPNWPIEKIESEADKEQQRHSKVKSGDNVLHINHCGNVLSNDDFESIESSLGGVGYELSRYDTSGQLMASAEEIITGITLYLSQVTVKEAILLGMGTNAVWDAIKIVIVKIYQKVRDKTVHTITSKTATERNVTFDIVINYDKDFQLKFVIENIPENKMEVAIDHIKVLKKKPGWVESRIPQVAIYNPEDNSWDIVNYNSGMLKSRSRAIRTLPLEDYINEVSSRRKNDHV